MRLRHLLVCALLTCHVPSLLAVESAAATTSRPPIHGILFNEDGDDRFRHDPTGTIKPERLDQIVDALADSQVTAMLICCCSQNTTHDTKAPGWKTFCNGFDPAKGNDQPFFGDIPEESRRVALRKSAHNQRVLLDAGVDPVGRMVDRCHTKGISPWISIRMNDIHDAPYTKSPLHSPFWKEHHEYWRYPDRFNGWYDRCLNYALQPVRDRMMALIREVCDRFDIDGLELDYNRFPAYFREGEEIDQGKVLTEWMAEVRAVVHAAAEKWKHPIWLAARVPARPEVSMGIGLDAVTWAKRGLIDHLIVAPFVYTTDFDVPVDRWNDLLKGTGVGVTVGLEWGYQPYPKGPEIEDTAELRRGAAMGCAGPRFPGNLPV